MPRWLTALILGLAVVGGHFSQRRVDSERFEGGGLATDIVELNPAALRVVTFGYHQSVAALLWVRAVLSFSDVFKEPREEEIAALRSKIASVGALDPTWRTVWFYGGSMLRVLDRVEDSDEVFREGMKNLPQDPYFPFALGMNAWLYRADAEEAGRYLGIAAELPGAPGWYAAAAAGFLDTGGQRRAGLRYLAEQIEAETDPDVRGWLERKYTEILHDERAEAIGQALESWRDAHPGSTAGLGRLEGLPEDPLGGRWILGADGQPRSSVREERLAAQARIDERLLLGSPPPK